MLQLRLESDHYIFLCAEFQWILMNFKNVLKFMNFTDFKRPGTEFSIYDLSDCGNVKTKYVKFISVPRLIGQ